MTKNKRLLEQLFAVTNFIVLRWGYYNPNLISDCLRGYSKQSDSKEEV